MISLRMVPVMLFVKNRFAEYFFFQFGRLHLYGCIRMRLEGCSGGFEGSS